MQETIRTLPELHKLKTFKGRRGIRHVAIDLSCSNPKIGKLETQINKSLKACGCQIGAAFVAIGLLALTLLLIIEPHWYTCPINLFEIVGFIGALAFAGKITGLAIANWRLRLAIDEVQRTITNVKKEVDGLADSRHLGNGFCRDEGSRVAGVMSG